MLSPFALWHISSLKYVTLECGANFGHENYFIAYVLSTLLVISQCLLLVIFSVFWAHWRQFFSKIFEIFDCFFKRWNFPIILIKYCCYPQFLFLTLRDPKGHHIDFSWKFLLGKKIAHVVHVWEEKESLINSIWWGLVPVTC